MKLSLAQVTWGRDWCSLHWTKYGSADKGKHMAEMRQSLNQLIWSILFQNSGSTDMLQNIAQLTQKTTITNKQTNLKPSQRGGISLAWAAQLVYLPG